MNHNHEKYQARLDFVHGLLGRLKLGASDIGPVQYDPESPFKYSNFVYRVTLRLLASADHATSGDALQPGCVAIPEGTKELIVRLTDPASEGMHRANRVENEGSAGGESSAAKPAQGWILQELMPGSPLVDIFDKIQLSQKKEICRQMATLLKGLQSYKLPESITGLEVAMKKATDNEYIKGWEANGLRKRLDKFVAEGVPNQFEDLSSKEERVVTHADFNSSNLLFDPTSGRITALIDYDFATILHPWYEFLRSFSGTGGQFRGPVQRLVRGRRGDEAALRNAKLHGFPSPLPSNKADDGTDKVADVDTVLQAILPWRVTNSDVLKLQAHETIVRCRNDNEEHLDKLLTRLGF
ncbi:hypothetical protein N658DRAFT_566895 [Parathielavia hyrcaniae]|uniref:Aminoglycoside phosphotransferase domain-containing protein n=1 Tax=Parathielavia hyrcaniae TaxID=113614 RepID=A0AAN6Q060_9PEZI|nr:hypothetical protein N658DRAFT_566895 [Parathielavia hyrcaniae]